jgi:hypothetical protein
MKLVAIDDVTVSAVVPEEHVTHPGHLLESSDRVYTTVQCYMGAGASE